MTKDEVLKEVLASNLSSDAKIFIIQNLGNTTNKKIDIPDINVINAWGGESPNVDILPDIFKLDK